MERARLNLAQFLKPAIDRLHPESRGYSFHKTLSQVLSHLRHDFRERTTWGERRLGPGEAA
ncbi:hypothetical protein PY32053_03216 [Paracoccus yeei]|uniref:Uncharacterized protein n=2 Tax=Alphaproteobacteria TaxID=28211 RepID=A0A386UPY1_9RHOB|nr:hypothetical protein PY32053_03216 [Paracoccus yeei]OYR31334.1 hypothetical protein CES86_1284 [Brucella lupini]